MPARRQDVEERSLPVAVGYVCEQRMRHHVATADDRLPFGISHSIERNDLRARGKRERTPLVAARGTHIARNDAVRRLVAKRSQQLGDRLVARDRPLDAEVRARKAAGAVAYVDEPLLLYELERLANGGAHVVAGSPARSRHGAQ